MTRSDIRYIPFPDTWRKRWTIKLSRNYSDDRSSFGRNFARGGPAARDISVKFLSSISFLDSFTRKMMERSCREVNHGEGSWVDDRWSRVRSDHRFSNICDPKTNTRARVNEIPYLWKWFHKRGVCCLGSCACVRDRVTVASHRWRSFTIREQVLSTSSHLSKWKEGSIWSRVSVEQQPTLFSQRKQRLAVRFVRVGGRGGGGNGGWSIGKYLNKPTKTDSILLSVTPADRTHCRGGATRVYKTGASRKWLNTELRIDPKHVWNFHGCKLFYVLYLSIFVADVHVSCEFAGQVFEYDDSMCLDF